MFELFINILSYRATKERARRSSSLPRQRPYRLNRDTFNRPIKNGDTVGLSMSKFSRNPSIPRNYANNNSSFPVDRKKEHLENWEFEMDPIVLDNTPILCNKYVVGRNEGFIGTIPGKGKSTLHFLYIIFQIE